MFALIIFLIISVALVVLFLGLRKLKGLWKKVVFFIVWAFVFCGHDLLVGVMFTSDASKYAKITVYNDIHPKGFYIGERKDDIPGLLLAVTKYSFREYLDKFELFLQSGLYFDYKEGNENRNFDIANDKDGGSSKYFRIYADKNSSKYCAMSLKDFMKIYLVNNKIITFDEMYSMYIKYHSNPKTYKDTELSFYDYNVSKYPDNQREVLENIIQIANQRCKNNPKIHATNKVKACIDDIQFSLILTKEKVDKFAPIFKDKCIARKKIAKEEVSRYAFVPCIDSWGQNICLNQPNMDNGRGKFYYSSYIQDIKNGKILAGNIYARDYVPRTYSIIGLVNYILESLGVQSGGAAMMCGGENLTSDLRYCDEILIKEYYRKDEG